MNALRLIQNVRTFYRGRDPIGDDQILDQLNNAMEELSARAGIPKRFAEVSSLTGGLPQMPGMREAGVRRIEYLSPDGSSRELPLYSVDQANELYGDWENLRGKGDLTDVNLYSYIGLDMSITEGPMFAVYDPHNASQPILPLPESASGKYRIEYTSYVKPMIEMRDEPFGGDYATYHIALAYYATYILQPTRGDMLGMFEGKVAQIQREGKPGMSLPKQGPFARRRSRFG